MSGGDTIIVKGKKRTRPWPKSFGPDAIDFGSQITDDLQNQAKDFLGDGGGGGANDLSTVPNSEGEFEQTDNAGEFKYSSEQEATDAAKAALIELIAANPGIEIRIDVYKNSNGNYGFTNAYTDFSAKSVDGRSANAVGLYYATDYSGTLHNHPEDDLSNFDISYSSKDNQLAAAGGNVYIIDSQNDMYKLVSVGGGLYAYKKVSS